MRTMGAGEFKAKCLAVMSEVNATGEPLLVTKRGKPLARIMPSQEAKVKERPEAIFGCLRHMGAVTGDLVSSEFTDAAWEQMFDEEWNRTQSEASR